MNKKQGCGAIIRGAGQGSNIICGEDFYGEIFWCDSCSINGAQEERGNMGIYSQRDTEALAHRIAVHTKALQDNGWLYHGSKHKHIAAELAYRDHMLAELTKLYWEVREQIPSDEKFTKALPLPKTIDLPELPPHPDIQRAAKNFYVTHYDDLIKSRKSPWWIHACIFLAVMAAGILYGWMTKQ